MYGSYAPQRFAARRGPHNIDLSPQPERSNKATLFLVPATACDPQNLLPA